MHTVSHGVVEDILDCLSDAETWHKTPMQNLQKALKRANNLVSPSAAMCVLFNPAKYSLKVALFWLFYLSHTLLHAGITSPENTPIFTLSDAPPPGFEDLSKHTSNQIDVYFAGRMLTSVMAEYDEQALTFMAPEIIVALLPGLTDRAAVLGALSVPLSTHSELQCERTLQRTCPTLITDTVGIIFYPDDFKVELFVNPALLEAINLPATTLLSPSSHELAIIHEINLALSGGARPSDRLDLLSNLSLSQGTTRLHARFNLSNQAPPALTQLSGQYDARYWRAELGVFDSTTMAGTFINTQDLFGIKIARSLAREANGKLNSGNPIVIFLREHSRVDIFRQGRLLDSRFYPGGQQRLDTTHLPDGAYEIQVKIRNTQEERTEAHYFSRTSLLAPKGKPLYFFESGSLLDHENILQDGLSAGATLLQAGTRFRVNRHLGGMVGLLDGSDTTTALQTSWYWQAPGLTAQLGAAAAEHYHAWQAGIRHQGAYATSSLHHFESHPEQQQSDVDLYSTILRHDRRTTLTTATRLFKGQALFQASRRSSLEVQPGWQFDFSYRRPLQLSGRWHLRWNTALSVTNEDKLIRLGIEWVNVRPAGNLTLGQQLSESVAAEQMRIDTSMRYAHQAIDLGQHSITPSLSLQSNPDAQALRGHGVLTAPWYDGEVELQYTNDSLFGGLNYAGNLHSAYVSNLQTASIAPIRYSDAAALVRIEGETDASFQVLIDKQPAGIVTRSQPRLIALKPYQRYAVSIEALGDSLLNYATKPKRITIFPGNLTVLTWHAAPERVLIAQIIDANGTPLRNAQVSNAQEFTTTDAQGWLQTEIVDETTLELTTAELTPHCRIDLSTLDLTDTITVLDQPLTCQ